MHTPHNRCRYRDNSNGRKNRTGKRKEQTRTEHRTAVKTHPMITWPAAVQGPGMLGKAAAWRCRSTAVRPSLHTALYHATLPTAGKHQWGNRGACSLESSQLVMWAVNMGQFAFSKKKKQTKTNKQQKKTKPNRRPPKHNPADISAAPEPSHQQHRIHTQLPYPERTCEVGGISEGHALW